jgi:N-acetylmuramoyl-L-alanine amidase
MCAIRSHFFANVVGSLVLAAVRIPAVLAGEASLKVVYPPPEHQTTAEQIFLIGTSSPDAPVYVNGEKIEVRSSNGHFAPSFPLQMGENTFTIRQQDQQIRLQVTRQSTVPPQPTGFVFGENSLTPAVDIARQPGERVCLSAIAPVDAKVTVQISDRVVELSPTPQLVQLPSNLAALTGKNQPQSHSVPGRYQGCTSFTQPGNWGHPEYILTQDGQTHKQTAAGQIEIWSENRFQIAEVTADSGTARTGPGTSYSRLSPLPQGTQATISGKEGNWWRLEYGAWIHAEQVRTFFHPTPVASIVRSLRSQTENHRTKIYFPLQAPVPVKVRQQSDRLILTLYHTTAQTDTIAFSNNSLVKRLDWQAETSERVQYTFHLTTDQQWGYQLRYEGTTLVLSLRHPPDVSPTQPLAGLKILLDPGHGSENDLGARGPTGYPEKDLTLKVAKLLRDELEKRGATVIMTREGDEDLYPSDRVEIIQQTQPHLAFSLHYNALPDNGNAIATQGIGTFWYHPQAQDLAVFLHDHLVSDLQRPSYGVFWNNLALTRPTIAPTVLLELGFTINPFEFEWITNPQAQENLAVSLAEGIETWVGQSLP